MLENSHLLEELLLSSSAREFDNRLGTRRRAPNVPERRASRRRVRTRREAYHDGATTAALLWCCSDVAGLVRELFHGWRYLGALCRSIMGIPCLPPCLPDRWVELADVIVVTLMKWHRAATLYLSENLGSFLLYGATTGTESEHVRAGGSQVSPPLFLRYLRHQIHDYR